MPPIPLTWDGTDAQGQPLRWDTPGLTWDGFLPQPPPAKPMPLLHVNLGFATTTDTGLDDFTEGVLLKLYGHASYPAPPVTSAALTTAKNNFSAAVAAANLGGPAQTALKNNDRETLIALLRDLARYVEDNHGNDLAVLLGSGFLASSTSRTQTALAAPLIKKIRHGTSGQLLVSVGVIPNAKCYELRYALIGPDGTPGPWQQPPAPFTNSRALSATGLTPGAEYKFQARAIGGTTGASDWSDAVTKRSM